MKILQLTPAPQGTMLVWENGRKVPVLCFALIPVRIEDVNHDQIFPCITGLENLIDPYTRNDAKVVL